MCVCVLVYFCFVVLGASLQCWLHNAHGIMSFDILLVLFTFILGAMLQISPPPLNIGIMLEIGKFIMYQNTKVDND